MFPRASPTMFACAARPFLTLGGGRAGAVCCSCSRCRRGYVETLVSCAVPNGHGRGGGGDEWRTSERAGHRRHATLRRSRGVYPGGIAVPSPAAVTEKSLRGKSRGDRD